MNTNKKTTRILEDVNVNVKMKISALWAASRLSENYHQWSYLVKKTAIYP